MSADSFKGDEIEVSWGPELFTPIQYHTITVGPFRVKIHIQPGETEGAAFSRGWKYLDRMGRQAYQDALPAFLDRCKQAGLAVENARHR